MRVALLCNVSCSMLAGIHCCTQNIINNAFRLSRRTTQFMKWQNRLTWSRNNCPGPPRSSVRSAWSVLTASDLRHCPIDSSRSCCRCFGGPSSSPAGVGWWSAWGTSWKCYPWRRKFICGGVSLFLKINFTSTGRRKKFFFVCFDEWNKRWGLAFNSCCRPLWLYFRNRFKKTYFQVVIEFIQFLAPIASTCNGKLWNWVERLIANNILASRTARMYKQWEEGKIARVDSLFTNFPRWWLMGQSKTQKSPF